MKIVNLKSVKGIKIGEFCSRRCVEVLKHTDMGWHVEIKAFGLHLRWYPGKRFFFIRKLA